MRRLLTYVFMMMFGWGGHVVLRAQNCPASNEVIIDVVADPSVSATGSTTICVGGTATLTATPAGGTGACTLQWQSSPNGSSMWTNIAGATATLYTTPALTTSTFYRALYDCTGLGCDGAVSNTVVVTVVADPTASILGADIEICVGGSGTLTASISGGAGTPSYQWQSSTDGGSSWSNIAGATNSTLNTGALTQTTAFRVIIQFSGNGCEQAISAVGTLTVVPDPAVAITGGQTICEGGSITLTASPSGGTGSCTLQWQRLIGASWVNISGANAINYTTPPLTTTSSYRATYTCTGGGCDPAVSNTEAVVVVPDLLINVQPNDIAECVGGTEALSVSISGGAGNITYQWQSSINGSTWSNVSGATSASFTPPSTAAGTTFYRVIVSASGAGCEAAVSSPATVQIFSDPTVTITGLTAVCVGAAVTLSASSSGGAGSCTFQWQEWSASTWTNISGATGSTFTTPPLSAQASYRAILICSGSGCCE